MKTIDSAQIEQDFPGLLASGRSPEIPEDLDVYGWLIGSWELDIRHYWVDQSTRGLKGEAHFAWVLEGRAVQDVWIMPRRQDRPPAAGEICNSYGTTLLGWDAALHAWRVSLGKPSPL